MPQIAHTVLEDNDETVSSTVLQLYHGTDTLGFTQANLALADSIHLRVVEGAILYRYSGSDPTTDASYYLGDEGELILIGKQNLANFRVVRFGSNDAKVFISLNKLK